MFCGKWKIPRIVEPTGETGMVESVWVENAKIVKILLPSRLLGNNVYKRNRKSSLR